MASVMEAFNASSTAIPASIHATIASANTGILSKAFDNVSPVSWFGVFVTLFLAAVVYDQSAFDKLRCCYTEMLLHWEAVC